MTRHSRSRPRAWVYLALAALAAGASACEQTRADDSPGVSARPALLNVIGPIPGPKFHHQEQKNPYSGDSYAMAEGRKLFVHYNCAGCHGGRAGGGMGPSLRDTEWVYGNSDAAIFGSIAQGRANGMPAWGVRINHQQIWQMVTYIQSLRSPNEPEAPTQ